MKRSDFSYHLPPALIAQEPREPGDVRVLNDTRVIPARLFGRRAGMTRAVEVLLTRPVSDGVWEAWAKPAKRLRAGDELTFSDALRARVEERHEGTIVLRFDGDLGEIDRVGGMPLPP